MDKKSFIELSQLGRLLFDKAALRWQWSIFLGFASGLMSAFAAPVATDGHRGIAIAILAAFLLVSSYVLRLMFLSSHSAAETMRRQSAFGEGLGWSIGKTELGELRLQAGKELIRKIASEPRDEDYYDNSDDVSPKKLAKMTFQSSFWTCALYRILRRYLIAGLFAALFLVLLLISLTVLPQVNDSGRIYIVQAIYLFIPVVLSLDFLSMSLALDRSISELAILTRQFERLAGSEVVAESDVLRLVSEYNCVLSGGVAIPNWLYRLHNGDIEVSWNTKIG